MAKKSSGKPKISPFESCAPERPVQRIIVNAGSSDVEVKKSHFLGALSRVQSEAEARAFIDGIRKKHYDARHNCFAMRIGTPENVFERSGDDGEPQGTAGRPMLEILKGAGLYDVVAVVTRYFGGTLLGTGGLVRAYSDSLKEALDASELSEVLPGHVADIECSYPDAEKIKRMALSRSISALSEEYGEKCRLRYLLTLDEAKEFARSVTEVTAGASACSLGDEVLMLSGTHPEIYEGTR